MARRRLRTRAEQKATDSRGKAVERSWDERATVSAVAATAEGEERAAGAQGLATSARAKERKRASTHPLSVRAAPRARVLQQAVSSTAECEKHLPQLPPLPPLAYRTFRRLRPPTTGSGHRGSGHCPAYAPPPRPPPTGYPRRLRPGPSLPPHPDILDTWTPPSPTPSSRTQWGWFLGVGFPRRGAGNTRAMFSHVGDVSP